MTTKQLSIFIENKSGTMLKVLDVLQESQIQIIASTVSDTEDYGIFRIICDQPMRAYQLLSERGVSVTLTDVFAIELVNTPGRAAQVMSLLAKDHISISYLYSFTWREKGILIFRTNDTERTRELIMLHHLRFVTPEMLHADA